MYVKLTLHTILAYDLLTGPLASEFGNDTSRADAVLAQAKALGDTLKFAFNTPTGISDNSIFLDPPRLANSTTNGVATIGTLVMEWTRLSDLTGDPTYGELAQKGESYLINPLNPELGEPFPGLLGSDVSIANGSFVDSAGGWTGGTDSYYEYLIKMYLYDPDRFSTYKDRWVSAVESSIKYLASHPTSRPDLTFLSYYYNNTKEGIFYYSEHCKSILGLFGFGAQERSFPRHAPLSWGEIAVYSHRLVDKHSETARQDHALWYGRQTRCFSSRVRREIVHRSFGNSSFPRISFI